MKTVRETSNEAFTNKGVVQRDAITWPRKASRRSVAQRAQRETKMQTLTLRQVRICTEMQSAQLKAMRSHV